jgi:hypothetical protein
VPELLGEAVGRESPAALEQQKREERPLPTATKPQPLPLRDRLDGTQQVEVDCRKL